MAGIFLGVPTYDGWLTDGCARAAYGWSSDGRHDVIAALGSGSLLCGNCNRLLASALNQHREEPELIWFALLHADVAPEPFWLDILVAEAERVGADLLSAVVPIKDQRGVTSTALASGHTFGQRGRLTMAQLRHPEFPQTFDLEACADALARLPEPLRAEVPRVALLANTGCMIVRLDRPWSRGMCFQTLDDIYEREDGTLEPRDLSEDWHFSWQVARLGGRVFCTSKLKLQHRGQADFPNDRDWPHGRANDIADIAANQEKELQAMVKRRVPA